MLMVLVMVTTTLVLKTKDAQEVVATVPVFLWVLTATAHGQRYV